ncbi:MAG: glycoside hydrolase family 3 protein [Nocardioides sp.]
MGRTGSIAVALLATLLVATGCTQGASEPLAPTADAEESAAAGASRPSPAERLGLRTGWGPSRVELDRAARLVDRLTLPELAGQVIVADWRGTGAPTAMVRRLHLGGVIAFSQNVTSTSQVRQVNARLRRTADREWPLFLAVDQEGGIVQRVRGDATQFPAFMSAGAADRPGVTRLAARTSGAELSGLGFTVDFAPDADVTSGPGDPTIGSRSAGSDPRLVAEQVLAAAEGYLQAGVVPVVKHFPGHGSVPADSHLRLPVQTRSLPELRRVDLAPFRAAVEAGLPAVMVGHLDVRSVDPRVPSSLSRRVVTGLLRHDLGFEGLVVTDSLAMAAVSRRGSARVTVQALRAGNDVALMPDDPAAARAGLVRAVRSGVLTRSRLEQAAARQVALLLHQRGREGAATGSGRVVSRALSSAAVTVVAGPCRGPLLRGRPVPIGDPAAVAAFRAAAGAAGLTLGRVVYRKPPMPKGKKKIRQWRRLDPTPVYHGVPVGFAGYRDSAPAAEVLVATDAPYVLGTSTASVRIATYGDSPGAMGALVAVLQGRRRAPGRLPVEVAGVPRTGC